MRATKNSDSKDERQALDDRIALVSVLQELTVAALDLFDPSRSLDEFLQKLAARLGCRVVLCLEAETYIDLRVSLRGSAGLARASRGIPIPGPGTTGTTGGDDLRLPYPELSAPNLKRWIVQPRGDVATRRASPWWLFLYFDREPRLPRQYKGMLQRLAEQLGVAFAHRRLYERVLERERALAATASRLQTLIDHLPAGVLAEDATRLITHANKAFCEMFGIAMLPSELVGFDGARVAQDTKTLLVDPDGFISRSGDIVAAGRLVLGDRLVLSDGRVIERDFIPIDLADVRIGHLFTFRDVTRAFRAGEEVRRLNEHLERRVEERTSELAATNRELGESLATLRETQDQLIQTSKLAAVGQLAAGLSHEINNPLAVILGFAQGLELRVSKEDPLHLAVTSIVREATRCKALVQELLTFSRTAKTTTDDIEPNLLIRGAGQLLEARARTQCTRLTFDLGNDLPILRANRTQLEQVLINLGNNALDAMQQGGELSLRSRRDKAAIVFEVRDTGPGIPEEIRPRIFEPFFTTKEVGKGTGLGLSLVYEIIQQHGGDIEVRSQMGVGTSMLIRIPARGRDEPCPVIDRSRES